MASTDHSHSHHGHGGAHGHGAGHGHGHGGHGVVLNHETTDVSLTGITRIAILSFVILFAILGLVYAFWSVFAGYYTDTRPTGVMSGRKAGEDRLPVGPLVITDEPGALRQLRAKERDVLHHYGWVDKNQGVVRIPIERAIEVLSSQPNRLNPDGSAPVAAPAAPATAAPAAPQGTTPPDAGAGQPVTPPPAPKPPAAGGH